MSHLTRLFKTYGYTPSSFLQSLAPSTRYKSSAVLMMANAMYVSIDKIFGLDQLAFFALALVFVCELVTGVVAAHIRGENISSAKLSRFTLKVACYLVLVAVTYLMSLSFNNHKDTLAAYVMDWLHVFLVVQIILENVVSILENLAEINGKEKPTYISKITEKVKQIIG